MRPFAIVICVLIAASLGHPLRVDAQDDLDHESEEALCGFMQVASIYSSESIVDMQSNCAPDYVTPGKRDGHFMFITNDNAKLSPHLIPLYRHAKILRPLHAINCTVHQLGHTALSSSAKEFLASLAGRSLDPSVPEWVQTLDYTQIKEFTEPNGLRKEYQAFDPSNFAVDLGINLAANAIKRRDENIQRNLFFKNLDVIVRASRSQIWRGLRDLQACYGPRHPTLSPYDIQITAQPVDRLGNTGTIAFENLSGTAVEDVVIIVEGKLPPEYEPRIDGYYVSTWKPNGCITLPKLAFPTWTAGGSKKPSGLRCMLVTKDGIVFDQELSILPGSRLFPNSDKPRDRRLELVAQDTSMQLKDASAELMKLIKQHNDLVSRAKDETKRCMAFAERVAKTNKSDELAARVQHAKDLLKKGDFPEPFYGTFTNQLKLIRHTLRRRCDELKRTSTLRRQLAHHSLATKVAEALDRLAAFDKLEKPLLLTSADVDVSIRDLTEQRDRFFNAMEHQLEILEKEAVAKISKARTTSEIREALLAFYAIRLSGTAPASKAKSEIESLVGNYVELVESKTQAGDVAAFAVLRPVLNRYRAWHRDKGVKIKPR